MARRKTKKMNSKKASRQSSRLKNRKPLLEDISPQRQRDILAILLILLGVLTLVSLITQSSGSITAWWINALGWVFGWGTYLLPILWIGMGVWVLLRSFERIPKMTAERVIGIFLLFINLLTWFHFFISGERPEPQTLRGGGLIGDKIENALVTGLGKPGAAIALIAWLMISLVFSLDLTMVSLLQWITRVLSKTFKTIQQWVRTHIEKNRKQSIAPPAEAAKQAVSGTPSAVPPEAQGNVQGKETTGDPDSLYYNQLPQKPVWVLPDPDEILDPTVNPPDNLENDRQRARVIEETLRSFGAPAKVVDIRRGPTITLFGVEPAFVDSRNGKTRVRVSKITSLADDLALALAAAQVRIQAPVPGKGYIGIEVPNQQVALVSLREIISSPAYTKMESPLKMALGKDVAGNTVAADLTAMPHLLIAGTTGAGKSVCINDILTCFLLRMTPDELRLVLVDPKRVELTSYNGIPHLLSPVIVEAEHVVGALQWMLREMDIRYRKFSATRTRNIGDYNALSEQTNQKKLPYLLVVIDELADLMMLAPDETERTITRLAQQARATGIHLIIATQRPSTDIITGLIKANFPARIAFAVFSSVDSRVILDQPGAERLLGRGDMLFQAPDAPAPLRIQSAFVSDAEINRLATYWRGFTVSSQAPERPDMPAAFANSKGVPLKQAPLWEEMEEKQDLDPRFDEAVSIIKEEGQASISMLQRKMRIGYTRAARIVDKMEEKGIVSEPDPRTQIREVLTRDEQE
jgi:S-DNA-T family DNA segregation ATPase FtsK/SpoIIIE